jgi:hypothetical protein
LKISYLFEFADRDPIRYELTLDGDSFLLEAPATDRLPDWTALEFEQCPNCPLSTS